MDKNDEINEFIEQIQKIKEEELKKKEMIKQLQNKQWDEEVLRVISMIQPIIDAFVKSDSLLQLQRMPSDRFRGFQIVYVYVKSLELTISGADSGIQINAVIRDTSSSENLPIYSGNLDENKIKKSIIEALIQWYQILQSGHIRWRREI